MDPKVVTIFAGFAIVVVCQQVMIKKTDDRLDRIIDGLTQYIDTQMQINVDNIFEDIVENYDD